MISAISGTFEYARPPKAVISTALGIEFEVIVSAFTLSRLMNLRDEDRQGVRLVTAYFHNDETGILYGFSTDEEKELFCELIKVNGIAAKQAMKILSSVSVEEFKSYLATDNLKALSKIPGIGAKTAGKIILDLKSKLVKMEPKPAAVQRQKPKADSRYADVISSLSEMGYEKESAESAVLSVEKETVEAGAALSEEEMFRRAFRLMTGNAQDV